MSSSTTAAINGEPVEFLYRNGALKWTKIPEINNGTPNEGSISDNDVLMVISSSSTSLVYTVYSIAPLSSSLDALPVPDVELRQTTLTSPPQDFLAKHLFRELSPHLSLPAENIHVVISTKSGTGRAAAFFAETLKPALMAMGLGESDYQVMRTESQESINQLAITELRDRASKGICQTVLLLSGDGGVVDLLNGLMGAERLSTYKRPTILLFPLGTGNALFHSLHRPLPPSEGPSTSPLLLALHSLLSPTSHPLPNFRATFSSATLLTNEGRTATPIPNNQLYGCIVASYGFHSTLVADSDTAELRKYGDKRFQIVAQQLLADPHRYKSKLTLAVPLSEEEKAESQATPSSVTPFEEDIIERRLHAYILCTLVSNLEKAFTISPASMPLDGKMRVIHFDSSDGNEIMDIMKDAYNGGKHVERNDGVVAYDEVESMRIDFLEAAEKGDEGKWLRVCIDGLIVRVEEGGWMKVKKMETGQEVLDIVL